jgi:hypothetical protein
MAVVNKIDSNATGLRYCEEDSLGTVSGDEIWVPLEPNSYDSFGAEITTVARNPINSSRQRKKGVTVDLDSSGGFNTDLTQTNIQALLQGFFFADLRRKGEEIVTAVDIDASNPDEYEVADTTGFQVNDLILGSGFTNAGNNSLNLVTAVVASTSVEVADGVLTAEASPPSDAQITVVGHQAGSADLDVDASGTFPAITSTTLDFTTLGLIPGEWIFVGGDGASEDFVTAANNGWKRIKSITATILTLDKSDSTMVTETGTGLTVRLFFGRVLKNELDTSIVRRSYQLERQLGAPNDSSPSDIQAEYVEGAVPSEMVLNIPTADKITADLSFIGTAHSTIDGATSLKAGTRPSLVESDAFNTSSDFSRIKLATVDSTDEAPTALFAFAQDITINLSNNLSPNKAIGTLGSFEVTAGTFAVSGDITAYFADVAGIAAVQANSNITLDIAMAKSNKGIVIDLPLISLGDGRPNVEQDEPITLPLSMDAATAALIDENTDYTLLMTFFDYLPTAAE